ncbi:MAG: ABC transporter permease subunit [Candidatus Bathyarchaeota archaeon]|nr:MAG: ABC transporter permease subunit [Candidatus Bathyarchaeota archaeon]
MNALEQLIFLLEGVQITLSVSVLAFLLGIATGIPMMLLRAFGGKLWELIVEGYEKLLRGVPIVILMLLFYFGIGVRVPFLRDPFVSAALALGIRSGAYQSQIFKGAMRGVGEDQMIAARALGMSKLRAFRHVVLPQMFIIASAGLGSEYALIVKDSAYAFFLGGGLLDVITRADILRAYALTEHWEHPYFAYILTALIYIALTFPLATYLDRWGSRKKKRLGI